MRRFRDHRAKTIAPGCREDGDAPACRIAGDRDALSIDAGGGVARQMGNGSEHVAGGTLHSLDAGRRVEWLATNRRNHRGVACRFEKARKDRTEGGRIWTAVDMNEERKRPGTRRFEQLRFNALAIVRVNDGL